MLVTRLLVVALTWSIGFSPLAQARTDDSARHINFMSELSKIVSDYKESTIHPDLGKKLLEVDREASLKAIEKLDGFASDIESGKLSLPAARYVMMEQNYLASQRAKKVYWEGLDQIIRKKPAELDRFVDILATDSQGSYSEIVAGYHGAYTRMDKIAVLRKALLERGFREIDNRFMASVTTSARLTKLGLMHDIALARNEYAGTKLMDPKLRRILLVGAAVVVGAGLISYGIANGVYKNQYQSVESGIASVYNTKLSTFASELSALKADLNGQASSIESVYQKEYDEYVAKNQAEYNSLLSRNKSEYDAIKSRNQADYQALIAKHNMERDALLVNRTNQEQVELKNYVRTVCETYRQPNMTTCNNLDYAGIKGDSVCTVMCMREAATGKQTMFEAPVCTDPFIPANCFSQAKYDAEYKNGYNVGNTEGLTEGGKKGGADGTTNGKADGKKKGYADGYAYGYDQAEPVGFKDGYNKGYYERFTDRYDEGYKKGFNDGYYAAYDAAYKASYNSSYNSSYDSAYNPVYKSSYNATYTPAYNSAYTPAYNTAYAYYYDVGWDAGLDAGYSDDAARKAASAASASGAQPDVQFRKGAQQGFLDARFILKLIRR